MMAMRRAVVTPVRNNSNSEAEPERQLYDSGFTPAIRLPEILVIGRDQAALIVSGKAGVQPPDLRMVQYVEDLAAERRLHGFPDREILHKVGVDILVARHAERVPMNIAILAIQRTLESSRVDPSVLVLSRIGIADDVRVLADAWANLIDCINGQPS